MSTRYVGYGFNTNDIPDNDWVALAEKYDKEEIEKWIAEQDPQNESSRADNVLEYIDQNNMDRCEYLADTINFEEKKKTGIDDNFVTCYNDYLVFDNIAFLDYSKRAEYIRKPEDFIAMVARYVPVKNIKFGNVYDGTDWIDPAYWIE